MTDAEKELRQIIADQAFELKKWRERYDCCNSSPDCANNKTKKFVEFMLGRSKWSKKKEELYCVIESLETDRDMNTCRLKETMQELSSYRERERVMREALKYIVDHSWVTAGCPKGGGYSQEKWILEFVDVAKQALLKLEGK